MNKVSNGMQRRLIEGMHLCGLREAVGETKFKWKDRKGQYK